MASKHAVKPKNLGISDLLTQSGDKSLRCRLYRLPHIFAAISNNSGRMSGRRRWSSIPTVYIRCLSNVGYRNHSPQCFTSSLPVLINRGVEP